MDFTIRAASLDDCKDISRMILKLAEHDNVSDQIKITQRGIVTSLQYKYNDLDSYCGLFGAGTNHTTFTVDLEQDGFSKNPFFHGIIAEVPEHFKSRDGHTKVGYSLYFYTYSSWKGRAVYMEDLYVMPEFRGKGIGKALMAKVSQLGLAAGCTQLNFTVLDWNKSSLDFYRKQGCWDVTSDLGYHCMRCEGDALEHLGGHLHFTDQSQ
ncbi:hypothetical protein R3I93_001052 [Phoxinus phoxinus]|uniref:N-acetyltransferase domain-containing protein n=1 Tax=Phoxinus phoxinus TaxID=58324 RepID=A0AAN9DQ88_9TELE